uniref:Arrestin_C domain-containing protein n=1 Tax=Glossina brevipalpis TaxID=37001 RepID=A0A1A9WSK2_9MUSC
MEFRLHPIPLEKQITKTISLFGTRPITTLTLLPVEFAVRGEPMRVCVTVINNSKTNVEKLRFCILQYINYHSFLPVRRQKIEVVTVATKEAGVVQKKSERSFAHELIIPLTTQPADHELSEAINISYDLGVEAVLRGRDHHIYIISGNADYTPSFGNGAGNPFEPHLDDIGSSMHSSQRGESSELSSMNSTTTVSLTASPYTSDSSSMYGNTSTRASLRNSNVPVHDSPRHRLITRR